MSALGLLIRRKFSLADVLPIVAFAAASGICATVLAGTLAFLHRLDELGASVVTEYGPEDVPGGEAAVMPALFMCALLACVLLLPNAVSLGGAAARLSLSRRERDLAAVRLIGGTRTQVAGAAIADVTAQAFLGALVGVSLHLAAAWPLSNLDFGITPFTAGDLILPWWGLPLVPVVLCVLAAGSAAVALTGVALNPLGIARGAHTVRMSAIRVVVWVLLIGFFIVASTLLPSIDGASIGFILVVLFGSIGLMVAGVNVAGPFFVWIAARFVAAVGPTPGLLVGARRAAADPRAGWRAVSGVTMALVVAGFASLVGLFSTSSTPEEAMISTALVTGAFLTVGIASVLAAVSTGVTQAARVIDQAPQYRSQHIAGAGLGQLHRARVVEIAIPVVLSLVTASFMVVILLLGLVGGAAANLQVLGLYMVSMVASLGLVVASALASSLLVAQAAREGRRTE